MAADSRHAVRLMLRWLAVVGDLLQLTKKSIGFLLRQIHWAHSLPQRVVELQEFWEEAFDQTVLEVHWLVVVVRLVALVGLAGLVEVVAAAHWEGEHLAWTASVERHSAVRYSVPVSVLATPSPSSHLGAPHLGG